MRVSVIIFLLLVYHYHYIFLSLPLRPSFVLVVILSCVLFCCIVIINDCRNDVVDNIGMDSIQRFGTIHYIIILFIRNRNTTGIGS